MEGGAPNNFLLLKNDRLAAPFGSTVKKGWLHGERGNSKFLYNLCVENDREGPEEPTSDIISEMRYKSLNRNRTNVLSRASRFGGKGEKSRR
jgi:hypothetical protein